MFVVVVATVPEIRQAVQRESIRATMVSIDMPRPSRSLIRLLIVAVLLAGLLPGAAALHAAIVDPQWVLLPDLVLVGFTSALPLPDEQPVSLLALLPSRAPPALSFA